MSVCVCVCVCVCTHIYIYVCVILTGAFVLLNGLSNSCCVSSLFMKDHRHSARHIR
jgi:hypothetical protein